MVNRFLCAIIFIVWILMINAQIDVMPGDTYIQDFDEMGTSQTAVLPSGWRVSKNNSVRTVDAYNSAVTQTDQRAGNNMSSTAPNGIYNFGAGDPASATDRAVGGLSSSSASKSVNVYVHFRNNSANDITSVNVSFKVEKYRNGSNAAGFTVKLYYSFDGTNWTPTSLSKSFNADADNNGYASAPGVEETISGTLALTVSTGQSLYFAWNYSVTSGTTTSNAQALGIDDVVIQFVGSTSGLMVNPTSISGLDYLVGNGPSLSQSFTVQGSGLTPSSGNITVTAPANFEVSLDNVNFNSTINLPYTSSTLSLTTLYVRLIGGLSAGFYNGNIAVSGGGVTTQYVAVSGTVANVSSFEGGDFAVLSVCSNINCQGGGNGDDEISFISFRDIQPGDEFIITDNGYQRVNSQQWGNSEGTYKIVRTGNTIPAGTVVTIRLHVASPYFEGVYPDNDWTMVNLNWPGTTVVLNSNGDQIYFFQGGAWNKGSSNGSHDAIYTPGKLLFAFNTNNQWLDFGNSTQHSGLFPGVECFSMMPAVATDFLEYTGLTTPATKREWIDRINNPSNWTNRIDCNTYFSNRVHYGQTYTILPGGYSPGVWLGSKDNNWFNCENWQNLQVPDSMTDVTIPSSGVTNEPTIGAPPTTPIAYVAAYSRNITIESGRTLTMNNTASRLDVYGNFVNNGTLAFSNGTVYFRGANTILSGNNLQFYNLTLEKKLSSSVLSLSNDVTIANVFSLKKGLLSTGSNMVVVSNTSTSAITNHSTQSYINGKLRRYVAATGSYDFPIGTSSYYELANITLNSSSGLTYIDGYFTSPHSTSTDITSHNVFVNGTQLTELLNYGFWTFEPSGGSYNYDITLTSRGHTNEGPTAESHAIVKRPNAASNWVSQGTHLNSDQSMVSGVYVTAKRRNLNAFSDFAIAKSDLGNLPVEFISFDVWQVRPYVVELTWSTASETNCALYEIELWQGGSYVKSLFHPGSGNTHEKTTYSLTDQEPGVSTLYLLYQEDFDGKRHLLDAKWYESSNSLLNVYAVNENLKIEYSGQTDDEFILEIFDLTGRLLMKKEFYMTQSENMLVLKLPFKGLIHISLKSKIGNFVMKKTLIV